MDFNLRKLSSGLKVLSVPMASSESATITVWVKTGSRNELKEKLGISHFLEHMVFKGSKKYPKMKILFEIFDEMGAEHNAGTTKEWTNFWVKLPVGDIERGFDILSDVVLHPLLSSEEMLKERQVIFEEMKMYEDTPMRKIGDVFENLIFGTHPLSWDIIGNVESMNKIDRQDFLDYRDSFYRSSNMLVSVAGGVGTDKVESLAQKYFSDVDQNPFVFQGVGFDGIQNSPRIKIKEKNTDQAHLLLGFPAEGRNYKDKFAQAVMAGILGGGASSRLWTEVREKRGLAYAVSGSMDRYSDVGYFGIYIGSDPKNADEAIKVALDQAYRLADKTLKVTSRELKKIKGYIKGHIALQLEDSDAVNDFFSEQILFDSEVLTPEKLFAKIDAITIDEVYKEAEKVFDSSKTNLAVIGPYKTDSKFVKLLK
jgi:predicted Zn-dependent peptidase